MTWLGHENSCQLQSGLSCDCRLPGEDPCTCPPVDPSWHLAVSNGPPRDPECPLHGEPRAACTCGVPQPSYGHLVCSLHGIDPREPRYLGTLSDGDGDLG